MDRALVAIEGSKVFLPQERHWLPDLLGELQAFPYGDYNDQVDALSQAVWFFAYKFKNSRHNPEFCKRSRVIGRSF